MGLNNRKLIILILLVLFFLYLFVEVRKGDAATQEEQQTLLIGYNNAARGYPLGVKYYLRRQIPEEQRHKSQEYLATKPGIKQVEVDTYSIFVERAMMFSRKEIDACVISHLHDLFHTTNVEFIDLSDCNPNVARSVDCEQRIDRLISRFQY